MTPAVPTATHALGALSVVTYSHRRTVTIASRMIWIGSTLSKKSLTPGCDRSSIRRLIVGTNQSGRGGVGGGDNVGAIVGRGRPKEISDWRGNIM
jgi:hypothetical protein